MKQTQRFASQLTVGTIEACHVAARPVEARHEPKQHRINARYEHNRKIGIRCPCSRCRTVSADSNDDGRLLADQINRQGRQAIDLAVSKSKVNFDIPAFDIAGGVEALLDRR